MMRAAAERVVAKVPVRYQRTVRQFMKFFVTGIIGTAVDYTTFNVLYVLVGWTVVFEVFGYPVIGANLASVPVAILSNFLLNKYWTFRDNSEAVLSQGVGYFVLNMVTFTLNQFLTGFFAFRLPILALLFPSDILRSNIAKALAIGIILFLNFFGSKFLVFRKQAPPRTRS